MASWFQSCFWEYPMEAAVVHLLKSLEAVQDEYSWLE